MLAVNVQISNTYKQDSIVLVVYRLPGQDINNFVDNIIPIIKTLSNTKKTCYIFGDLNIDLLNYDNHTATQLCLDAFISFSFRPLINIPTRITESTSTLIDNIFTNNFKDAHISGIFYTDISDHFPVFSILSSKAPAKDKNKLTTFRKITLSGQVTFKNDIGNTE